MIEKIKLNDSKVYIWGLSLLIIGNICFYNTEASMIYFFVDLVGMGAIFICEFCKCPDRYSGFRIDDCIVWLSSIFLLFTIYGCFFLRSGEYSWDVMLFKYAQNIAYYIALKNLLCLTNWLDSICKVVGLSIVFVLSYILVNELENIASGSVRIGASIGNVNVIGTSLGILSIFMAFYLCKRKSFVVLLGILIVFIFMLLTGSKKTVIIIISIMLMILAYAEDKLKAFFYILAGGIVLFFAIFNIQYLYDIIGYRIENMVYQLLGIGSLPPSNSTNERLGMIMEGFVIFLDHPLFGGGMKYFGAQTTWGYGYSHCNYVELLCNFGIVGTMMYYFPYIHNLLELGKHRKENKDKVFLSTTLLIVALTMDWMMVSYSDICVFYIPVVFSFACLESIKRTRAEQYFNKLEE